MRRSNRRIHHTHALFVALLFSDKDKTYQEKLESQRCLARQLGDLEKTLQFSREDSEAYASLEEAYNEEVGVSLYVMTC